MSDVGYGRDPDTGSRFGPDERGGGVTRRGNRHLRDVPEKDRVLEIVCYESRQQPHLVALVARVDGTEKLLTATTTPHPRGNRFVGRAQRLADSDRVEWSACRCAPGEHAIDPRKVSEAVEHLRYRHRKARSVDVRACRSRPDGDLTL
ncbi:MAG: hypothetical protein M3Q39_13620 [Actinomycetota bacterium]|nr:hypothetical protein [Actinomycetota bacterium]